MPLEVTAGRFSEHGVMHDKNGILVPDKKLPRNVSVDGPIVTVQVGNVCIMVDSTRFEEDENGTLYSPGTIQIDKKTLHIRADLREDNSWRLDALDPELAWFWCVLEDLDDPEEELTTNDEMPVLISLEESEINAWA